MGIKTTAAVKYRHFGPSWWELAARRTMIRPWGSHYPRYPSTKRGEESGIFPRLSPTFGRGCRFIIPHTWGHLTRARRGALGSPGSLAQAWPRRPCQGQVVPPTSCRDTPERRHGVMTVHERMLVDRPSPHPTPGGVENSLFPLPRSLRCVAPALFLLSPLLALSTSCKSFPET